MMKDYKYRKFTDEIEKNIIEGLLNLETDYRL